jgi:2-(acetamidomethylene)succinate hydrolase
MAPDMRGHGKSEKPETGYRPEDHARDLAAILNKMGISQAHIVGHSTGGRNALVFAGLYPGVALSLTIIDQTLLPAPDRWKEHESEFARYPTPFDDEPSLDRYLELLFPGRERKIAYEKTQFEKKEDGKWDWVFSITAILETQRWGRAEDLIPLLSKVECPVLFIKGMESAYVSSEEAAKITSLIRNGRFVGIEKAGHGVFRDNPKAFFEALLDFIKPIN